MGYWCCGAVVALVVVCAAQSPPETVRNGRDGQTGQELQACQATLRSLAERERGMWQNAEMAIGKPGEVPHPLAQGGLGGLLAPRGPLAEATEQSGHPSIPPKEADSVKPAALSKFSRAELEKMLNDQSAKIEALRATVHRCEHDFGEGQSTEPPAGSPEGRQQTTDKEDIPRKEERGGRHQRTEENHTEYIVDAIMKLHHDIREDKVEEDFDLGEEQAAATNDTHIQLQMAGVSLNWGCSSDTIT